jgi:hypothetical protein
MARSVARRRIIVALGVLCGLLVAAVGAVGVMAATGYLIWDPPRASSPNPRHLQPVYALPSDVARVAGREEAILHEVGVVTDWYRQQLDGRYPRFGRSGKPVTVDAVTLPWTRAQLESLGTWEHQIPEWLRERELIADDAVPMVYVESSTWDSQCATTTQERVTGTADGPAVGGPGLTELRPGAMVIFMSKCEDRPDRTAEMPGHLTLTLATQILHLLGAVSDEGEHLRPVAIIDDPRDPLYQGSRSVDREHLTLDPGHDDYYRHGRTDRRDIATSELLTGATLAE